jgi:hypothetical protein
MFNELKARLIVKVREVFQIAGAEIVDADDDAVFRQQRIAEMRSEKTGSPGHQHSFWRARQSSTSNLRYGTK